MHNVPELHRLLFPDFERDLSRHVHVSNFQDKTMKSLNLDSSTDFSVPNFNNIKIAAFVLHRSTRNNPIHQIYNAWQQEHESTSQQNLSPSPMLLHPYLAQYAVLASDIKTG